VDPEVTRIIAAGADAWARFGPADVYLRRDLHQIRTNAPDVSASLADGLSKFGTASVIFVHSRSRAFSEASFDGSSEAVYQRMASTEPPIALGDSLRQILTALPGHTALGFIKYSSAPVISWASID